MYTNTLKGQWENLCADFSQEFDRLKSQGNIPSSLNSWYNVRIHRWNSIAYSEGIILGQQDNPDFSRELLDAIGRFTFRRIDQPKAKSSLLGIITGAFIAIGAYVAVRYLLGWGAVKSLVTGAAAFAVCTAGAMRSSSDGGNNERQGYISQLEGYWPELEAVCEKFGVS